MPYATDARAIDPDMRRIMRATDHDLAAEPDCRVVVAGEPYRGKQGHLYRPGISAETVGSRALHLQLLELGPGEQGQPHLHAAHETAIYVLSGESGMWFGPDLRRHVVVRAGHFLYIPPDMPHLPYNRSDTKPCVAVIARTDPNEQESVVLLPQLKRPTALRSELQ